ncbi:MAG: hypothetical protein WBG86_05720 [Polyangiales bacterium]
MQREIEPAIQSEGVQKVAGRALGAVAQRRYGVAELEAEEHAS